MQRGISIAAGGTARYGVRAVLDRLFPKPGRNAAKARRRNLLDAFAVPPAKTAQLRAATISSLMRCLPRGQGCLRQPGWTH